MKLKLQLILLTAITLTAFAGKLQAQTELLQAGNMESESGWTITYLNTPEGEEPAATWNYTDDAPASGAGGNLYVTGLSNNSTVHYCIYQPVHMSEDSLYTFDAAFKILQEENAWCEVYVGPEPVDGEDYGDGAQLIGSFGFWAANTSSNGTFGEHAADYKSYAPQTTDTYYLVVKLGSTSWDGTDQTFEMLIDELSLVRERVAPVVDFSADVTSGFAPLTVNFIDMSAYATSWSWDFGDGSLLSSDHNPMHEYTEAGTYSVSLTATNEKGNNILTKTDYITVSEPVSLPSGGSLSGAGLEDESEWNTSFLNTPAGSEPAVTWNYTDMTPDAGTGGCLMVEGESNGNTVQYAIYQQVTLDADSVYYFDGAFRDLTTGLDAAWCEIYIGSEPVDGLDYGEGEFKMAQFNTWEGGCTGVGVNGTFGNNACVYKGYVPEEDGDFYFVVKMGTWSDGNPKPFKFAIDDISLTGVREKPMVSFSSQNPLGFAPLTVDFVNETKLGNTYSWDFGDGSAVSTDKDPSHTYSDPGSYTVSLTAENEVGESVVTKTDFVKVNEKPELPEGEMLYGGNMEDPNLWNTTNLNADIMPASVIWNYTDQSAAEGEGGALYVSGTVQNGTTHYCIWQPVELHKDSVYKFDAAFRAISELNQFWAEAYIATVPPVDGEDFGADSIKISQFNTWAECTGSLVDGTFKNDGCDIVSEYSPKETGTYYFAIKIGSGEWDNANSYTFEVILDEVTLQESTYAPSAVAEFFTDVTSGDAPLTVFFTDLSENATAWAWDFGDGGTSTDQHPSYTYQDAGVYTVTLVAMNEVSADTMKVDDLITVNMVDNVFNDKAGALKVYPNPSNGVVKVNLPANISGEMVLTGILGNEVMRRDLHDGESMIQFEIGKPGIYVISIYSETECYRNRVVVK